MIIHQLKAIKKVALENLHKSPHYFETLIDEIDLTLMEIESEKIGLIDELEMECDGFDNFNLEELAGYSKC